MMSLDEQIDLEMRKCVLPEMYNTWLNTPNTELDFRTPQQCLAARNYQPLWTLIANMQISD